MTVPAMLLTRKDAVKIWALVFVLEMYKWPTVQGGRVFLWGPNEMAWPELSLKVSQKFQPVLC